jgi:hypothetical protein
MAQRMAVDYATQPGLCGEQILVISLLRQAILDLHSPRPDIRSQALDFLHDGELVEFWTSLVGIDREAWQEHAQQALRRTRET